jgi:murein DD-endopeptidase MepM/ murein hydrolase activator NlpD
MSKPDLMKLSAFRRKIGVFLVTGLVMNEVFLPLPTFAASKWVWPMQPAQLSSGFDRPQQNWLPGHRGVDLVAIRGDQVFAAGDGVVSFAGQVAGKSVIVIRHGILRTTYEPVTASVLIGAKVRAGDLIGRLSIGNSHCSTQTIVTCLHWGLLRGETYLNPLSLVKKQVRLLPNL